MKLSVFTPLPPTPSGIADYSALLLEELQKRQWDVTAVAPAGASPQPFPVVTPETFDGGGRTLYQVGNSSHHDFLYPAFFDAPGVLVLHDLVLHHARLSSYLMSEDVSAYRRDMGNRAKREKARVALDAYRREVASAYPEDGAAISAIAIRMGGGRLLYSFPLYEHLARRSALTIVHSESARAEILERCPETSVMRVRMGIPAPAPVSREQARKKLDLPDKLLLASFGLITPEKRIRSVLQALARLRGQGVDAHYVLVGGQTDHYDVRAEAASIGVGDQVHFAGRVSEEMFSLYAFAADICLNLRYPSAGETSATLLRLLACGRPVLVTDQVHSGDFPSDVVALTSLDGDEDGLYCDLVDLIRAEPRRRTLERESRAFVLREHSIEAMADDYAAALATAV